MRLAWLKLARLYRTPRRLLQSQMSFEEFKEQLAYFRIEPHYDEQYTMYMAQIALLIAEVNRDRKVKPDSYKLLDFLFDFDPKPEMPITEDRIEGIFRGLAEVFKQQKESADGNNSEHGSKDNR